MAKSATRPLIGITLDSEEPGGYSNLPWYALRENYSRSIIQAGGLPVALPHEPEQAEAYLDQIDGVVITGGAFDVDPAIFGAENRHPSVTTKDRRTAFELAITRGAPAGSWCSATATWRWPSLSPSAASLGAETGLSTTAVILVQCCRARHRYAKRRRPPGA